MQDLEIAFLSIKMDEFSYSSHQNPMRIRWDRVCEKIFPIFYLWVAFLTKYFTHNILSFLWEPKLGENDFFRKLVFSAENVGRSIWYWK